MGSDWRSPTTSGTSRISIHAPRVGSDLASRLLRGLETNFNPRSPCGERRLTAQEMAAKDAFQSTLPVWGATKCRQSRSRETRFQSTLPVWGATSDLCAFLPTQYNFNPRSPCGERRSSSFSSFCVQPFQSTLPVWGATMISRRRTKSSKNFNPRSPCGERRRKFKALPVGMEFQSTLPVWGATRWFVRSAIITEFQSTLPVWGATACFCWGSARRGWISIHAPRVGSDPGCYH